jgi:hypothetical protein
MRPQIAGGGGNAPLIQEADDILVTSEVWEPKGTTGQQQAVKNVLDGLDAQILER